MKLACIAVALFSMSSLSAQPTARDFYQIKIYHLKSEQQERRLDDFLKNAYLPALHRTGLKSAGVFKPIRKDDDTTIQRAVYVFLPFHSRDDFFKLEGKLAVDKQLTAAGGDYINAAYDSVPYERIESILLTGFDKHPTLTLPELHSPHADRVYELRSYEGPTEKLFKNKVKMFNDGDEVGLFKRLGFNAVFYAEVISGCRMPNLMYMTTFENKEDRDKHWDAFGKDDYWKKLSAMPQYQHNVSTNDTRFLYPADYSDF